MSMKDGWMDRLLEVIEADTRSMRSVSQAAGLGVNYITQVKNRDRTPGADYLAKIMTQYSDQDAIYVYVGFRFSSEDIEVLRQLSHLSPDARAHFLDFLRNLSSPEDTA